jgi:hypothetical protein
MLRDGENLDIQGPIFGMCIKTSHKIPLFLNSICLSVSLFSYNNSRTIKQIFMELGIREFA